MKKMIVGAILFVLVAGAAVVGITAHSNRKAELEATAGGNWEIVPGNAEPVSYARLYEMPASEILRSDAALLLFKTLDRGERERLLGKGTPANINWEKYFPEYVRINNDELYTGDYHSIRRIYATYKCSNGTAVIFGESDKTRFCVRVPSAAINPEQMSDQFSAGGYEKELIYCTLISVGNIPAETSFSDAALSEYLKEKEAISAFLKEAPDRRKVAELLGTPATEYGNVRTLLRNPENTIEALDKVLHVRNPGSKVSAIRYMYPAGTRHIRAEVLDVQLFADNDPGRCGTTALFFDGWLSITFDAAGNFLYAFERTDFSLGDGSGNPARYIETMIASGV